MPENAAILNIIAGGVTASLIAAIVNIYLAIRNARTGREIQEFIAKKAIAKDKIEVLRKSLDALFIDGISEDNWRSILFAKGGGGGGGEEEEIGKMFASSVSIFRKQSEFLDINRAILQRDPEKYNNLVRKKEKIGEYLGSFGREYLHRRAAIDDRDEIENSMKDEFIRVMVEFFADASDFSNNLKEIIIDELNSSVEDY